MRKENRTQLMKDMQCGDRTNQVAADQPNNSNETEHAKKKYSFSIGIQMPSITSDAIDHIRASANPREGTSRTFSRVMIEDAPSPREGVLATADLEPAVEHPQADGMSELIDRTEVVNVENYLKLEGNRRSRGVYRANITECFGQSDRAAPHVNVPIPA